jgi:adenylate cyclase class 2
MKLEIEAKVKVGRLESVAEKLRRCGAKFLQTVREEDLYFNSGDGALIKKDCGLRLRKRQTINGKRRKVKEKIILTYKGPRGKSVFKSRQEAQVEVDDFEATKNVLLGLGYKKHLAVNKIRQIWQLSKCEICLDRVRRLGTFVEIEGPNEKTIAAVMDKLGLDKNAHISKGYARMTAEKIKLWKIKIPPLK